MNSVSQTRLAGGLTVLAGIWLLVSPLLISVSSASLIDLLVVGTVFAGVGILQLFWLNAVPGWANALAAIWLFIAAFAFTASTLAAWNQALVGIIVFLLSVWNGLEVSNTQASQHHAHM
ncbi:MAG: SPW repeat domain-containing protein [Candidatus Micrarchaeaceae archaeon]